MIWGDKQYTNVMSKETQHCSGLPETASVGGPGLVGAPHQPAAGCQGQPAPTWLLGCSRQEDFVLCDENHPVLPSVLQTGSFYTCPLISQGSGALRWCGWMWCGLTLSCSTATDISHSGGPDGTLGWHRPQRAARSGPGGTDVGCLTLARPHSHKHSAPFCRTWVTACKPLEATRKQTTMGCGTREGPPQYSSHEEHTQPSLGDHCVCAGGGGEHVQSTELLVWDQWRWWRWW